MPTVLKDRIIFNSEDWLSGLDPQFDLNGIVQVGKQLAQSRSMNPYRYLGLCCPGFQPTDVTNVSIADSFLRKGVVDSNTAYIISSGTKLHKLANLDTTPSLITSATFPHTISGATGGQDEAIYWANTSSTRTKYLFYSWKDGSNGNIGIYDFASTFDDDWLSTVPTNMDTLDTTNDHPLIVGDDDILYIGDGNNVHAVDGVTGADSTLNKEVLTIPKGYVITSFAKYNQYLVIFAYLSTSGTNLFDGESRAFFWDYTSLDPTYSKNLNDNQVSEAFIFMGTIGCFTQGKPADQATVNSKVSKLLLYNGSEFVPVVSFDKNIPIRGGVDIKGNFVYWNSQGAVYCWDNNRKTLNQITEGLGTSTGLLSTFSRTQFISSGATTSGGLQTISSNYFANSIIYTGLAHPDFPMGFVGRITKVKIKYGKTSNGGRNILVTLRDRIQDVSVIIQSSDNLRTITSDNLVKEYTKQADTSALGKFDTLRALVQWETGDGATDAPLIETIEVFYELHAKKA